MRIVTEQPANHLDLKRGGGGGCSYSFPLIIKVK